MGTGLARTDGITLPKKGEEHPTPPTSPKKFVYGRQVFQQSQTKA